MLSSPGRHLLSWLGCRRGYFSLLHSMGHSGVGLPPVVFFCVGPSARSLGALSLSCKACVVVHHSSNCLLQPSQLVSVAGGARLVPDPCFQHLLLVLFVVQQGDIEETWGVAGGGGGTPTT